MAAILPSRLVPAVGIYIDKYRKGRKGVMLMMTVVRGEDSQTNATLHSKEKNVVNQSRNTQ